jgi:hypothetical protein
LPENILQFFKEAVMQPHAAFLNTCMHACMQKSCDLLMRILAVATGYNSTGIMPYSACS